MWWQCEGLDFLKFIYSEKATKFCEILHTVKSKGKISQNFVAFSEYVNFMDTFIGIWPYWLTTKLSNLQKKEVRAH